MNEPERLFSQDSDLAGLHEILDRDEPPRGAVERATQRVLAECTSGDGPLDAGAAQARRSFRPWIFVGVGAMILVTGAISRSSWEWFRVTAPLVSPAEAIASAAVERGKAAGDIDAPPTPPSIRVEDLPTASPPLTPSAAGLADPFLEELALVERARTALTQRHAHECLDATMRYERRFAKSGLFREEVEVMRIESLAISGERANARARGHRFLEAHRDTPYGERIRRVLDEAAE